MKSSKHSIIAFFAVILIGVPWLIQYHPSSLKFIDEVFYTAQNNFATVFLHNVITINQLKDKYNAVPVAQSKVRILIVPGHEPNYGGAEYKNLKERDMTVELAKDLQIFLSDNDHYEIIVSRDENSWNSDLQTYFTQQWSDISAFFKEKRSEMVSSIKDGSVVRKVDGIYHNSAPQDVALRLYGINKWANENKIDIVIHIHINDNPRGNISIAGEYSGISIYIPEKQFANSSTTKAIADSVFKRLTKYNAISNLPKEDNGVIEDQDLIAIGSNNTSDVPSMLIEYGYIYEPQFADKKVRELTIKDLAFQTYLGIQDFFGERDIKGNSISLGYDTLMLPYDWKANLTKDSTNKEAILALQSALVTEGLYPSNGMTKNDCPRTGKIGNCTLDSLSTFQNLNRIKNEKGMVGKKTLEILNNKYSIKAI